MKSFLVYVKRTSVACFSGIIFVGCASHVPLQAEKTFNTPLATGKSRIVVLRKNGLGEAISMTTGLHVVVQGTDLGLLEFGSYQVIDVVPGTYAVRLYREPSKTIFKGLDRDYTKQITTEAGEVSYYQCLSYRAGNSGNVVLLKMKNEDGESAVLGMNEGSH